MSTSLHLVLLVTAASAVAPLLRVFLQPRFAATFPRIGYSFGLAIAGYWAALAAVAILLPQAILPLAVAAVVFLIALRWRARTAYGRKRGLPPGSLSLLPAGPWVDRRYYTKLSQVHGPIFKTSHFFHPMVCLMNLEEGLAVLKQHDDIHLRSPKVAADRFLPCGFLRGMDPEHHKTYRKLAQSLITPQVLAAWEPAIAADLERVLPELAGAQGGVYAKPAWDKALRWSFARLFFGILPDTEDSRTLDAGLRVIALVSDRRISIPWLPSERRTRATLDGLCALLRRQTAPNCFLAELRKNPEFKDSDQMLRLLIFMLYLAASDMAGLMQWLLKTLCEQPEAVQRLRSELDAGVAQDTPVSLTRAFVSETLRRHQVEHLYRRVLEDFEWQGYRIPKGWLLRICVWDAHRNPQVFADPEAFRPERFLEDTPPQNEFLPFGAFRRSCIGDGVAHTYTRQFLCTVVQHWDLSQVGESHEDYRAWHWTPGADFHIRLTRRSSELVA